MNPLLVGSSQVSGPILIGMAVMQIAGYAALTVGFGLGILSLRPRRESRFDPQGAVLRWIRAGFLLLSAALILHSTWTTFALGEFWVWDPAKNMSLLVWLVYAGLLHMHHVPTLRGRNFVIASLWGWSILVLLALGMTLLRQSAPLAIPSASTTLSRNS